MNIQKLYEATIKEDMPVYVYNIKTDDYPFKIKTIGSYKVPFYTSEQIMLASKDLLLRIKTCPLNGSYSIMLHLKTNKIIAVLNINVSPLIKFYG